MHSSQPSRRRPHEELLQELRIERKAEIRKLNKLNELLQMMAHQQRPSIGLEKERFHTLLDQGST